MIAKEGSWYKVNYNLQVGYMHADYLSVKTARNAELGYGKVNGSSVNLRSGPGTSYKSVGTLKKGDTSCYIIGINNGWYKVITGSKTCYIRSDYLGRFLDFHGQDVLFLYSTLLLNNSSSIK